MVVECKASPDIPFAHLVHFVQRARAFPADISLLLIDTESESLVTEYVGYRIRSADRYYPEQSSDDSD